MRTPASSIRRFFLGTVLLGLLAAGAAARAEVRPVGAFQGIHVKGPIDVQVRQSTRDTLELQADDKVLPLVESTVVDRGGIPTLELSIRKGASLPLRTKIVATVEVATLKALAISGAGDVVADGIRTAELRASIAGAGDMRLNQLDAGALSVSVAGSGDVVASGRAGSVRIAISGSGDVSTRELAADEVKVSIAGSGDAKVHARKTLAVSIAGSGDVGHVGEATPTVSVVGSGSVKKL
jgi:hypothetical protein